jgi:hypothetical protein
VLAQAVPSVVKRVPSIGLLSENNHELLLKIRMGEDHGLLERDARTGHLHLDPGVAMLLLQLVRQPLQAFQTSIRIPRIAMTQRMQTHINYRISI